MRELIKAEIERLKSLERKVVSYSEREWQDSDYNAGLDEGIESLEKILEASA